VNLAWPLPLSSLITHHEKEVAVCERRGEEAARGQSWWAALQDAQEQIAQMPLEDAEDRQAGT
jgi:hypothetical protein